MRSAPLMLSASAVQSLGAVQIPAGRIPRLFAVPARVLEAGSARTSASFVPVRLFVLHVSGSRGEK